MDSSTVMPVQQCGGAVLNMDSGESASCGGERPPELSEVTNSLCQRAASFIRLWDKHEPRLRQIVAQLQEASTRVKKLQKRSKKGGAAGAVAVRAAMATPLTGGLSFAITIAVVCVAVGAAVVGFKVKQLRTEEDSLKTVRDFLRTVTVLESELEGIVSLCEDMQREAAGVETGDAARLKNNVVNVFLSTAKLRAAGCVRDFTAQCQSHRRVHQHEDAAG